jgi:urease accessory protein
MKTALKSALLLSPLLAGPAFAHVGSEHAHSLLDGVLHPVLGWDHAVVALVAGVTVAQCTPARRWRMPALFLGGMALAMMAGAALPFGHWVENGIALSLLAAGVLLACVRRGEGSGFAVSSLAVMAFAGAAHGVVHGVESAAGSATALYTGGILAGTALLHASGIALGVALAQRPSLSRSVGVMTAAVGAGVVLAGA